jgi:hypothetical protein
MYVEVLKLVGCMTFAYFSILADFQMFAWYCLVNLNIEPGFLRKMHLVYAKVRKH